MASAVLKLRDLGFKGFRFSVPSRDESTLRLKPNAYPTATGIRPLFKLNAYLHLMCN